MEGKTPIGSVILGVIVLSLAVAHIQVEAIIFCPSTLARNCYKVCGLSGKPQEICANNCGCKIISGTKFLNGYEKDILENSGDVNEYCKLGCASSVCNAITTLQNSGKEVVNEAVEKCYNACSAFCTKGFTSAVETA